MTKRIAAPVLWSVLLAAGSALAYAPHPAVLSFSTVSRPPVATDCSLVTVDRSLPPIPTAQPSDCPTAILLVTPDGNKHIVWIYCGNDPVNNFDPLGLELVFQGTQAEVFRKQINDWLKNLPEESNLREIVRDLAKSKDKYIVTDLKDGYQNGMLPAGARPYTESYWRTHGSVLNFWAAFKQGPPSITYIDNKIYNVDNRTWTFPQALAHELLHAHDWYEGNPRRDRNHFAPDWIRDEREVTTEAGVLELRRQ